MVRLLPTGREVHGASSSRTRENLLAAARALEAMLDRLRPARRAGRRDPGAWSTKATRSIAEIQSGWSTPSSRRSTARTSTSSAPGSTTSLDGIQAIAETMVIYDVETHDREARQLAGILAGQAEHLMAAIRMPRRAQGRCELHLREIHDAGDTRRTACRARRSAGLFRSGDRPARGHQVDPRPVHGARGDDRRRRGHRRDHRADRRQVQLTRAAASAAAARPADPAQRRPARPGSGGPAEDVADAADRVEQDRRRPGPPRSGCAASGRGRRPSASRRRSRSPRRARAAGRG